MTVGDVARPPLAMAYSRRKAEQIVTGLEDPINQHLLKLMAFDGGAREHWRRELDTWLTRIAGIVGTRTDRPFDAAFYRRSLFEEPFGGIEERNVGALLELIARQYPDLRRRNDKDVPTLVAGLRTFHERLADQLSRGAYDPALLEAFS